MNAMLLFIICTFANVIISTIKSVMTIKGGKLNAAFWNALGYGLYAYIVIMTANAPITTFEKIAITVGCNLVGVFGVKWIEEKLRKERLWKIEMTVPRAKQIFVTKTLELNNIPFNYIDGIGKYTIVNVYANTKEQTKFVDELAKMVGAKRFASETKLAP